MRMFLVFFGCLPGLGSQSSMARAEEVGELTIRSVLPLTLAQRTALVRLTATDDEARALLEARRATAQKILLKTPRPLAEMHYEGLVNTDPRRIETVERLRDMDDAALLLETWQATGDAALAAKAREYVRSWAATYRPTGNDVNENKLLPLFVIYEAMCGDFTTDEQKTIDAWLSDIARRQIAGGADPAQRRSNRHTKRMLIVATIGLALGRQEWLDYAWNGFDEFVGAALYNDGTSYDLKHRDTLTYHCSALRPLVDLAILAARNGRSLYAWSAPSGSSLKKSVDYMVPFADGSRTRREWVNSQVELDRRRAAAGLEQYQPGRLFDPQDARRLLEEASYFDPTLLPLVIKLAGGQAQRFTSWRTVVNAAARVSVKPAVDDT